MSQPHSLGRKANKISAFPATFHRKPGRLSVAGCAPAERVSVSPAKARLHDFFRSVKMKRLWVTELKEKTG